MGATTGIEWCDHTFNPWIGCQKVSPGCDHCYAEAMMDHRLGRVQWGAHGERKRTSAANWRTPRQWAKAANGKRPKVFCASLADVFDNQVPCAWRHDLFTEIRETPELDWLLLTKRPENIADMLAEIWEIDLPPNVWMGTTCEDQKRFDKRWLHLRAIAAKVRFISYEPALGPIQLPVGDPPDWIIVGGESGPHARPMHPDWVRTVRDQCQAAGVPFFFKQWGEWAPVREGDGREPLLAIARNGEIDRDRPFTLPDRGGPAPKWCSMAKVGKARAGRLLDGREWSEFPSPDEAPYPSPSGEGGPAPNSDVSELGDLDCRTRQQPSSGPVGGDGRASETSTGGPLPPSSGWSPSPVPGEDGAPSGDRKESEP